MIPKSPRWECKKLTDIARNYPCMNCGADRGTTVSAHANSGEYGKGLGRKADDCFIAFLCDDSCHRWLDQGTGMDPTGVYSDSREDKAEMWRRAHDRTLLALFRDGKVRVAA